MPVGRALIVLGVVLVVVGLAASYFPWLGRLPGDVRIERPGFSFTFPITTCLLLSAVLSLVFSLLSRR